MMVLVVFLSATTLVSYSNAKPIQQIIQQRDRTLDTIVKVVQSKVFLRAKSNLEKYFSNSTLQSLHETVEAMVYRYNGTHSPTMIWVSLVYLIEYTYMLLALLFGHNQVTILMTIALTSIIVIPALMVFCSFAASVVILQELFVYFSDYQLLNFRTLIYQFGILGVLIGMIVLPIIALVLIAILLFTFPMSFMDRFITDFWDTLGAVIWRY
ncbi:MAG: hypothetical protein MUC80_01940 [Candidatus Thermoplasmatota archaeon]|jgi:hypothetical protein|nr:hypothetical protein [Candidatus Thermoplasmatota archaeon]